MTDAALRVAGLGAGYFSQFHYDAWRRIEGVELIGVCDLSRAAAEATGLPAFADLDAMLSATRPDLLDIIVPPPGHAAALRAALLRKVPTVICQKPFCRDLEEATAIAAEAEAAGTTLVVHENFRFMPWYRAIRAALDAGRIGAVHQATYRLRPGDGQGPDAYLDRQPYFRQMPHFLIHETGVHRIDTFRFLFGDPLAVYADLRRLNPAIEGEDAGYVLFDHPNCVRAVFDGNRHLDHAADNLRRTMGEALVEGTDGTLTLFGDGRVDLRAFGRPESETIHPADRWTAFGGECVRALQTRVVAGVLGKGRIENRAAEYLSVVRVRDAIHRSAAAGRKIRF